MTSLDKNKREQILNEFFIEKNRMTFQKTAFKIFSTVKYIKLAYLFIGLSVVLLFVIIFSRIVLSRPIYTDRQTMANGQRFLQLSAQTGTFAPKLGKALDLLKKQPEFYAKVVNNVEEIKIDRKCPMAMACIETTIYAISTNELPKRYPSKAVLHINPRYEKLFNNSRELASVLVHEADHVEFARSNAIRRTALHVKCNPFLSFHILKARQPLYRSILATETCAEMAQDKFEKDLN